MRKLLATVLDRALRSGPGQRRGWPRTFDDIAARGGLTLNALLGGGRAALEGRNVVWGESVVLISALSPAAKAALMTEVLPQGGHRLFEAHQSRKVRLSPRDFGAPTVVVSAPVPEVVELGWRIVAAMGIEGFVNVEFKRDARDGSYKLMEVNGRPNMSGALAVRCGVDFPLLTFRHLVNGIVPTERRWRRGVYWIDEFADLRSVWRRWRGGEMSPREALTPYVGLHVFASFAVRDPSPVLARIGGGLSNRLPVRADGRRQTSRIGAGTPPRTDAQE